MNIPRIWLGYAQPDLERSSFYRQLGRIFMPATVQVMGQLGLQSYIPTVLPKIEGLPDELALVFYPSPQIYKQACEQSCAGRMYAALHRSLFQFPQSHSLFPENYVDGQVIRHRSPFTLFDRQSNWQNGRVLTEVWRNQTMAPDEFRRQVADFAQQAAAVDSARLDGVYFYVEHPFLICWSCWREETASLVAHLPGEVVASIAARPVQVPHLFAVDEGITVAENQSVNFQFDPIVF